MPREAIVTWPSRHGLEIGALTRLRLALLGGFALALGLPERWFADSGGMAERRGGFAPPAEPSPRRGVEAQLVRA
jgi:hypothetical protein